MNKLIQHKFWLAFVILILFVFNLINQKIYKRFDLTAEKRYSLSKASKNVLKNLDEEVSIEVFLKGTYPAGINRLKASIIEFLDECKYYSNGKLKIQYTNPFSKKDDSLNYEVIQEIIQKFGVEPIQIETAKDNIGTEQSKLLILPGAIATYKGKQSFVDLRREIGYSSEEEMVLENTNYSVESTLENKFINAIQKITRTRRPNIAYSIGNGEPQNETTFSLQTTLYRTKDTGSRLSNLVTINLKKWQFIPNDIDLLIVNKPAYKFDEYEKLKIDQYVLNGGSVLFCVDRLYAEEDSLKRSTNQSFIAFDKDLGLDDLLFSYGARINNDLIQDRISDVTPLIDPNNPEAKPQFRPFPFYPVVSGTNHPISKNLDGVKLFFPSSIDTIKNDNIKKTILLTSSENSRIINTPLKVDLDFVTLLNDDKVFNKKKLATAVLLEGKFTSHFKDRLSTALNDSLNSINKPYLSEASKPGNIILVADGDLALNYFTPSGMPLEMGENFHTKHVFSNKEFFLNCIEYLTGDRGILATRSKDFTLRILDPSKKEEQTKKWQIVTTLLPIILIVVTGFIFSQIRRRKYTK